MTKILITGVAGFLGSHLAEKLLSVGHEVVGVDNLLGGYRDNVPADVDFFLKDCRNLDEMKLFMRGVDVVYHCAASAHEGLSVFSPNLIAQHTYNSTLTVVAAAISGGVKRIVFCSSMARYGRLETPFTEGMEPRPVDPYGIAKYASELTIKSLSNAHGIEYVIAVPHNIIGPRQKYDDPYRNVASIMINLMLQGRQPVIYGDGEQMRAFSFVADVVAPLVKMGFQDNVVGETINVGPDEEFITINDLAKRIAGLLNFNLEPIYMPGRPLEVKMASCSADKARRLLGYKTSCDINTGLREMIEWIKERGTKPFSYHLPLEIINDKIPKTWKDRLF